MNDVFRKVHTHGYCQLNSSNAFLRTFYIKLNTTGMLVSLTCNKKSCLFAGTEDFEGMVRKTGTFTLNFLFEDHLS